jgi:hypothetical protein
MGLRYSRNKLAVGRFLYSFGPWCWWVTLTYTTEVRNRRRVEGDVRRWTDSVARLGRRHFYAAIGIEWQVRGALHAHVALQGGPATGDPSSIAALTRLWARGLADVEPFENGGGALTYLAKTESWGLLVACPRLAACRRGHGCSWRDSEVEIALA